MNLGVAARSTPFDSNHFSNTLPNRYHYIDYINPMIDIIVLGLRGTALDCTDHH